MPSDGRVSAWFFDRLDSWLSVAAAACDERAFGRVSVSYTCWGLVYQTLLLPSVSPTTAVHACSQFTAGQLQHGDAAPDAVMQSSQEVQSGRYVGNLIVWGASEGQAEWLVRLADWCSTHLCLL